MSKIQFTVDDGEAVAKRAFWLAWQACRGPFGMGIFQNNPGATEEDVWSNVNCSGDYPCNLGSAPGSLYGDYVFGRMMKLGITYTKDYVEVSTGKPRIDYQGWCHKYPSYEDLIKAAIKSLKEGV